MKRRIALLIAIALLAMVPTTHAASRIYWRSALTGSGSGALDAVSKTAALQTRLVEGSPLTWVPLASGDSAVVIVPGQRAEFYTFDAANSSAESSPAVIAPDDAGATGRWLRVPPELMASEITGLATVATTGSYNDLANTPSIPNVNALATAPLTCDSGQIAKYNGSTWVCAADGGVAGNSVLLVGDSRTARSNYFFNPSSGTVSGSVLTINAATSYIPVGSKVYIRNHADARLNGEWPVLSYSPTAITVQLDQNADGVALGTAVTLSAAQFCDGGMWPFAAGYSALNRRPLTLVKNFGIGGSQSADWVAVGSDGLRLIERVLRDNPSDRVWVDLGANDGNGGVTVESFAANMEIIYAAILATGRAIDAATSVYDDANIANYAAINALIKGYNGYVREKVACTAGMTLIDQNAATKAAGSDVADVGMMTTDGVHYSPLGARLCGKTYATAIASSVPVVTFKKVTNSADGYDVTPTGWNKVKNPLFTGVGGSHSGGTWTAGTVPSNWVVTVTGGTVSNATQPARANGIGNDYRIDWTTTTTQSMKLTQDVTALVPPSSIIKQGGIEIEVVTEGSGHYVAAVLQITTPAGEVRCAAMRNGLTYVSNGKWLTAGERVFCAFPPGFVIPADATAVVFSVLLQSGAAGSQSIKMGVPQLEII